MNLPKQIEYAETGSVDFLRHLDGTLRDKFPNYVQPGSGKISSFEE